MCWAGLALGISLRRSPFVVNALGFIVSIREDQAIRRMSRGMTKIEIRPFDHYAILPVDGDNATRFPGDCRCQIYAVTELDLRIHGASMRPKLRLVKWMHGLCFALLAVYCLHRVGTAVGQEANDCKEEEDGDKNNHAPLDATNRYSDKQVHRFFNRSAGGYLAITVLRSSILIKLPAISATDGLPTRGTNSPPDHLGSGEWLVALFTDFHCNLSSERVSRQRYGFSCGTNGRES